MKKFLFLAMFVTVFLGSCNKDDNEPIKTLTVSIGDEYEGGVVFYISEDKQRGLVAAPEDQSAGIVWSAKRKVIPTENTIGSGQQNTATIIAAKSGDSEVYAAKICSDLVLNGYDDWFLPSIDELIELYNNREIIGGFVEKDTYWSSSAIDGGYPNAGYTWTYNFNPGSVKPKDLDLNQHFEYRVRAVRSIAAK